jgi:hypothetical protein
MTERIRIQNEQRELERRAARHAGMGASRPHFQMRWSALGRIGQIASSFSAIFTRPAAHPIRSTQPQPPACDC